MKFLICFAALTVLYGCQAATLKDEPNLLQGLDTLDVADQIANVAAEEQADDDLVRSKKSQKSYGAPGPAASYGAPAPLAAVSYSYPSPVPTVPCGKSLLFSCQPSVAPVPCAAPAPSYGKPSAGYAGAYSEPVPAYAAPHFHHGYQGYYPQVHYAPY